MVEEVSVPIRFPLSNVISFYPVNNNINRCICDESLLAVKINQAIVCDASVAPIGPDDLSVTGRIEVNGIPRTIDKIPFSLKPTNH
jgi:hypothetical protein